MTPPRVCPSPEPARQKDCQLVEQRAISPDETLRRAILMERRKQVGGLPDLIRAEAVPPAPPPPRPALLPAPESSLPLLVFDHLKGASFR